LVAPLFRPKLRHWSVSFYTNAAVSTLPSTQLDVASTIAVRRLTLTTPACITVERLWQQQEYWGETRYTGRICREHYGHFVMVGAIFSYVPSLSPADPSGGDYFMWHPHALASNNKLEGLSRAHTPSPPTTLTFGLDLPKYNYLVPCGQGYDWPSLVTMGLELPPGSCSQTPTYKYTYTSTYIPTPVKPQPSVTFGGGGNDTVLLLSEPRVTINIMHRWRRGASMKFVHVEPSLYWDG